VSVREQGACGGLAVTLSITPVIYHQEAHAVVIVKRPNTVIVAGNLTISMKKENVRFHGVTWVESCTKLYPLFYSYKKINSTLGCGLGVVFPRMKQMR
jgi:hypothetical protein